MAFIVPVLPEIAEGSLLLGTELTAEASVLGPEALVAVESSLVPISEAASAAFESTSSLATNVDVNMTSALSKNAVRLKNMVHKLGTFLSTADEKLTTALPKMQEHLTNVSNLLADVHTVRDQATSLVNRPQVNTEFRDGRAVKKKKVVKQKKSTKSKKGKSLSTQLAAIKNGSGPSEETVEAIFNKIYTGRVGKTITAKLVEKYKKIVASFHKTKRLTEIKISSIDDKSILSVVDKVQKKINEIVKKLNDGGTYNLDSLTKPLISELANQFGLTFLISTASDKDKLDIINAHLTTSLMYTIPPSFQDWVTGFEKIKTLSACADILEQIAENPMLRESTNEEVRLTMTTALNSVAKMLRATSEQLLSAFLQGMSGQDIATVQRLLSEMPKNALTSLDLTQTNPIKSSLIQVLTTMKDAETLSNIVITVAKKIKAPMKHVIEVFSSSKNEMDRLMTNLPPESAIVMSEDKTLAKMLKDVYRILFNDKELKERVTAELMKHKVNSSTTSKINSGKGIYYNIYDADEEETMKASRGLASGGNLPSDVSTSSGAGYSMSGFNPHKFTGALGLIASGGTIGVSSLSNLQDFYDPAFAAAGAVKKKKKKKPVKKGKGLTTGGAIGYVDAEYSIDKPDVDARTYLDLISYHVQTFNTIVSSFNNLIGQYQPVMFNANFDPTVFQTILKIYRTFPEVEDFEKTEMFGVGLTTRGTIHYKQFIDWRNISDKILKSLISSSATYTPDKTSILKSLASDLMKHVNAMIAVIAKSRASIKSVVGAKTKQISGGAGLTSGKGLYVDPQLAGVIIESYDRDISQKELEEAAMYSDIQGNYSASKTENGEDENPQEINGDDSTYSDYFYNLFGYDTEDLDDNLGGKTLKQYELLREEEKERLDDIIINESAARNRDSIDDDGLAFGLGLSLNPLGLNGNSLTFGLGLKAVKRAIKRKITSNKRASPKKKKVVKKPKKKVVAKKKKPIKKKKVVQIKKKKAAPKKKKAIKKSKVLYSDDYLSMGGALDDVSISDMSDVAIASGSAVEKGKSRVSKNVKASRTAAKSRSVIATKVSSSGDYDSIIDTIIKEHTSISPSVPTSGESAIALLESLAEYSRPKTLLELSAAESSGDEKKMTEIRLSLYRNLMLAFSNAHDAYATPNDVPRVWVDGNLPETTKIQNKMKEKKIKVIEIIRNLCGIINGIQTNHDTIRDLKSKLTTSDAAKIKEALTDLQNIETIRLTSEKRKQFKDRYVDVLHKASGTVPDVDKKSFEGFKMNYIGVDDAAAPAARNANSVPYPINRLTSAQHDKLESSLESFAASSYQIDSYFDIINKLTKALSGGKTMFNMGGKPLTFSQSGVIELFYEKKLFCILKIKIIKTTNIYSK